MARGSSDEHLTDAGGNDFRTGKSNKLGFTFATSFKDEAAMGSKKVKSGDMPANFMI